MFIVYYRSESSDHYVIGPFDKVPSHQEVFEVFRERTPDEAEYIEEMAPYQGDRPIFYATELSAAPKCIDLQCDRSFPCERA